MKYTIEKISDGEEELILRYQQLTKEVEEIMNFMNFPQRKIVGASGNKSVIINIDKSQN